MVKAEGRLRARLMSVNLGIKVRTLTNRWGTALLYFMVGDFLKQNERALWQAEKPAVVFQLHAVGGEHFSRVLLGGHSC